MNRLPKGACPHCHGSGRCVQWCCKVFGNARTVPDGQGGSVTMRVCMICQGTGTLRSVAGLPPV